MRKLLLLLMVGCAPTPVVKLRVEPGAAMRLDPSRRAQGQAQIDAAKKALAAAESELQKAQAERTGPAIAAEKQHTPELDAILRAAEDRHGAMVAWRQALVEVARWQVAAAEAQLELITAEAVARTGADVDPARFRGQAGNMQSGRIDASRRVAGARTRLDQKEKALNDAKDRYAATLKPQAPAQVAGGNPR